MNIFPGNELPQEARLQRLAGLYPQRQEGRWMQRIKIHAGVLAADQWKVLGDLINEYTPGTPLHLTTRQCLEIHDLSVGDIGPVQRILADNNLTGLGACGDTLRNITLCTCSGALDGRVDLHEISSMVRAKLEALEYIYAMPRKFKISFNCSDNCGQPWINDLGFIVAFNGGKVGFRVIAAGSLGAVPATGIQIYDWIDPVDVLPVTLAAIDMFNDLGDRDNRRKARLRHVRERIGDEAFIDQLNQKVRVLRSKENFSDISLKKVETPYKVSATLRFSSGDITADAAYDLARLEENPAISVKIDNHHKIVVYATDKAKLTKVLARQPSLAGPLSRKVSIVACPGNRWCSQGLVDTNKACEVLHTGLKDIAPDDTTVCISGCPNDCAHGRIGDIGLKGCLTTIDGEKVEAFNIFTDGGMGRDPRLAKELAKKVTVDNIADTISEYLKKK